MGTIHFVRRLRRVAPSLNSRPTAGTFSLPLRVFAMTFCLAGLTGHVQPLHAQNSTVFTHSPPFILAAGSETPITNEKSLPTRPIGMHIFKTLSEVDNPETLKPGSKVDVMLTSLGEEGPKSNRILRKVSVYSVGNWAPDDTTLPNYSVSEVQKNEKPKSAASETIVSDNAIFPQYVVGLLVNAAQLETLRVAEAQGVIRLQESEAEVAGGAFGQIWHNFTSNLFQPLLLFFFMGFAVPLLKVPFDFPKPLYQSLTIYLLIAIGWHGGELMAQQSSEELAIAGGLVVIGFFVNAFIGVLATKLLEWFTPMRKIDAITVGAYYGSDSAGTFVTCLGILATLGILHDSYMPVLLAVMEIPGCLVGLYLVSRLRQQNMDNLGNMPGESGYNSLPLKVDKVDFLIGDPPADSPDVLAKPESQSMFHKPDAGIKSSRFIAKTPPAFDWKIAHEVFLNPGLYMLFGGIIVGFISGYQALSDPHVVEGPNHLFVFIFKGALCLFLLEMGITACRRLSDLKTAGWGFIAFGLLAPNLFAIIGMLNLHVYSIAIGHAFFLGTYALFAVLCGAASYIAVPAVQRLAIPEASPTLPLAASLGLTFTWNVTMGIPIYIEIAKAITTTMPV